MEKGKYILSAFLLMVILTSSVYFVLNENIRIDIQETRSIFKVQLDGKWVTSGIEYVNIFDGNAKMRSSGRTLDVETFGTDTIVTRTAQYKNNILVSETYIFQSNTSDVTLFPVSHDITVIGADRPDRPYILQYEVQKLLYTGETIKDVESPQSFGHKMEIEWADGNYYSRIYKYKDKDEGKLTVRYKIDSDKFRKNVRLFDPPENITVTLNSPVDNFTSNGSITYNCSASIVGDEGLSSMSVFTNESGVWEAKNTTVLLSVNGLVNYWTMDDNLPTTNVIDLLNLNNGSLIVGGNTEDISTVGKINLSLHLDGNNDYIDLNNANPVIGGNATFAAWINTDVIGSTQTIIRKRPVEALLRVQTDGKILWNTAGSIGPISSFSISSGQWYLIVGVIDDGDMRLYINGKLNGTINGTASISSNAQGFAISRNPGFIDYFNGKIDEVMIWNRSLSQSEINELYNNDIGKRPEDTTLSTRTWDRTIDSTTLWNCQACDTADDCNFSLSNRTVFFDIIPPIIAISSPDNITYTTNVTDLNYNVTESYPDKCWYSTDGGSTNSTPVASGTNFQDVLSEDGFNTWIVYCNDTLGQNGSSNVTFFMDINPPEIEYAANSDITNITGNFSVKDWVFINVTVNESQEKNITFTIYSSGDLYSNDVFTDSTRDINYTGLSGGMYFWNVTVCDLADQCNSTDTRIYGVEITNLTINLDIANILAELGGDILVNATSTLGIVYVDVNHPDYGINYSSGLFSTGFDLIINYFRNNIFNDSSTSKVFEFVGLQIKNAYFPAHQYDEIDSLSFNISGTNTTYYPSNITIYESNTSIIDRFFDGLLIGSNIYLNHDDTPATEINFTYSTGGSRTIDFLIDEAAIILNAVINITGIEFGFSYYDEFDNFSEIDTTTTTAQLDVGGFITLANSSIQEFEFDNFSGTVFAPTWNYSPPFSPNPNIFMEVSQEDGYAKLINYWDLAGATGAEEIFLRPDSDDLNLITSKNVTFRIESTYDSNADNTGCSARVDVYWGGSLLWRNYYYRDTDTGSNQIEESDADVSFILSKHNSTHWRAQISGIETSTAHIRDPPDCDNINAVYNWTNGSFYISKSSCLDESGSLDNDFFFAATPQTYDLVVSNFVNHPWNQQDNCDTNIVDTRLYPINNSLWYRENATVHSKSIYDASGPITTATGTWAGNFAATGITRFYLSADNGVNWENVASGIEHSFSNTGTNLKWRADLETTEEGYLDDVPTVTLANITTPQGFPTNITIDFGSDGIDDFVFIGELNSTNSPMEVNVTSGNISSSVLLDGYNHLLDVPMKITSATTGQINIDSINITYNPNPVVLSVSSILDYILSFIGFGNFPINISSNDGNITFDDVKYDYAGGNDTINVLAHNTDYTQNVSRNITYYYSRWDYEWVPENVEWIWFSPRKPTDVNVTPYGQIGTVPILNLTNYGYGGKNVTLSIYQNGTSLCVNTTISLDSNKSNGKILEEDWIELANLTYLETVNIYLWSDYNCSYSTWRLFEPNYYFRQCVDGGSCSTDLI